MRPIADKEKHLLALANSCLQALEVDRDYGMGLTMSGKRPFGNSGSGGLHDTLIEAGALTEDVALVDDDDYDYARELWAELPKFLARCEIVVKEKR